MVGYGLGAGWQGVWSCLGLAEPRGWVWTALRWLWFVVLGYLLVIAMGRFVGWQNDMRDTFGMERITATIWLTIIPLTFALSGLILVVARFARASGSRRSASFRG